MVVCVGIDCVCLMTKIICCVIDSKYGMTVESVPLEKNVIWCRFDVTLGT